MWKDAIEQQADSWMAVWHQLREGNPAFMNKAPSGQESALVEIRRLQEIAKSYENLKRAIAKEGL